MPCQDLGINQCPICRAIYPNAPPDLCPRCGADNRAWQVWVQAGWRTHLKRFLLGNRWGRLALISLLLPLVSWDVFGFKLFAEPIAILVGSLVISLTGLLLLFIWRDTLWVAELARQVPPRSRIGLLVVGGAGFIWFTVVGTILILEWGLAAGRGENLDSIQPATWRIMGIGLAFTAETLAAGLYSVYAYGRWLAQWLPPPIFWNETKLLALVESGVDARLKLKSGWEKPTNVKVKGVSRTKQAGLNFRLRTEKVTEKIFEGYYLSAVQHWRVVSDKWGRIRQFSKEGPLEYVPDPERVYTPPAPEGPSQVLKGELIFPNKQARPTLEDAILIAITSNR